MYLHLIITGVSKFQGYSYDPYQGYQHKEANEAALIERIKAKQVRDAFDVYQTCKKKG